MGSKNDILKGLFGDQVTELTEEQTNVISSKLDKLIESRVDAKVKFQTEVVEAEAKEKYDVLLSEATTKYKDNVKQLEEALVEKAATFKESLHKAHNEVKTKLSENKDSEIKEFKESIVEKLDKYLKLELDKKIPDTYVEAVAKMQIFEPIVEGMKKTFEDNYLKIDEENFGLLKDAREEIIKARESEASLVKENMEINDELQKYKRSMKISTVCEGLTDTQRERASTLLESYDVDEIEERFTTIRDIIIESDEKEDEEEVEVKVEEGQGDEEEVVAKADKGSETEEDKPESEEDVMNSPVEEKVFVPESADREALQDDSRLIESWAREFKRISK
jgi:hypothetical protein